MPNSDSYIQNLINQWTAPGSDGGEKVSRSELTGVLTEILGQVTLTDLSPTTTGQVPTWNQTTQTWGVAVPSGGGGLTVGGTPQVGYVPKWNGTALVYAPDDTAAGGTGWDTNGSLTANRSVSQNNFSISFVNNGLSSVPNIIFNNTHENTSRYLMISKSPRNSAECGDFEFRHDSPYQPGDTTKSNEVFKWGFNIDRVRQPTKNGAWYAIEPNWIPDPETPGTTYMEYHLSQNIVGEPGEVRLFSHTFVNRGNYSNSQGIWDFRCTTFNIRDFQNNEMFALAKNGSNGAKFNFIGPGTCTAIMEVGGTTGNSVLFYTAGTGGVLDLLSNKWSRWYFRNTKVNMALTTYASNAAAISGGLSAGDFYTDGSGNVKIVT